MFLKAYSIYDRKAAIYHAPFFGVSHGVAVRTVMDLVNDRSTTLSRHPADYVLYCVGQFDDTSGLLQPFAAVEHVSDALPLVREQSGADIFAGNTAGNVLAAKSNGSA